MNLPNNNFLSEVQTAVSAALAAGERIMEVYNSAFSHTLKKDAEPLTEADTASDAIINHVLSYTGHPILSEESADTAERFTARRVWIVDPLDGTSDFINRTGEFSVMIALVEKNMPVAGVVFCPPTDTLYIAQRGRGAYKRQHGQWQKMHVNGIQDVAQARVVVSRHHLADREKLFLHQLGASSFTQKGSSGLKIAEIADGRAELYFTMTDKIKQWDTCAAHCIITEAGGRITDMQGEDLVYNTAPVNHASGILATNGCVHNDIVERYRNFITS